MEIEATTLEDGPYKCENCGKKEAVISLLLAHDEKYVCPACIEELKRVLREI